ncbi:hypothetical protein YC2023_011723 [Brassica napus]
MSNGAPEIETEREQAQINVVSDEKMVQVENSETETQAGVEPKDHLMPPSCPHTLFATCSNSQSTLPPSAGFLSLRVATSQKDSSTIFCHSSSDAKSTLASTLACSSSAHNSLQIMDDVPSDIIINEGITYSRNDPLTMTFLSTKSNQEQHEVYIMHDNILQLNYVIGNILKLANQTLKMNFPMEKKQTPTMQKFKDVLKKYTEICQSPSPSAILN